MDDRLKEGLDAIAATSKADWRWKYYQGNNELPYAPKGVNNEYGELREQASLPLIRLAVRLPIQRLRVAGIRADVDAGNDDLTWRLFTKNRLQTASRLVYTHALALGIGVMSVWRGDEVAEVNVENPLNLHLHFDPLKPTRIEWAVKVVDDNAWLYTNETIYQYVNNGSGWELVGGVPNKVGRVPFVIFAPERDADGTCNSMVDSLVPMQRAIDTMRFNLLLAAQFAAFRQRIVVGYDPVLRDVDGNVVYKTDAEGNQITDGDGNPIPIINKPGKAGVDRLLVFPGHETKVFDLEESNLTYYKAALDHLISSFASVAQVPPQYLVGDFTNVSGDLMVATEATLRGHLGALQAAFSDAWQEVFELASLAQGEDYAENVIWADAEPKSLGQIADAAAKMVPQGMPISVFAQMLPGANQHDVTRWVAEGKDDLMKQLESELMQ